MTRQEHIWQAALTCPTVQIADDFYKGAEWADEHPSEEIQRLKTMFESDPDAYEQGYKHAVEKAWRWLLDRMWVQRAGDEPCVCDSDASNVNEFIEDFKKAMEEEQ